MGDPLLSFSFVAHRILWCLLVVLAGGLLPAGPCRAGDWFDARVLRVTDGDSLWVRADASSAPLRLRLIGLDAPEICQSGGAVARDALVGRLRLADNRVRVRLAGRDRYDRWLAQVQTADGDIGAWLVDQGLAWNDGRYAAQAHQALRRRVGLFAQPGAERPRDFRRRHGPCG